MRGICGKRRQHDQFRSLAAVEKRGRAAAGRLPPRPGHPGADFPEGPRALQKRRRQIPGSRSCTHVGYTATRSIRRLPKSPKKSTARRSPISKTRHEAKDQDRPAIAGLCMAERRRNHVVRQLDLFRLLDRSGASTRPPRHRRSLRAWDLSELGLVLAGESPRPLQPRFLRSRGQALGSFAQTGLVERRRPEMGGQ